MHTIYFYVPHELFDEKYDYLSPTDKMVYSFIAHIIEESESTNGWVRSTQKEMSNMLRIPFGTFRDAQRKLEAHGLIEHRVIRNKSGSWTEYSAHYL